MCISDFVTLRNRAVETAWLAVYLKTDTRHIGIPQWIHIITPLPFQIQGECLTWPLIKSSKFSIAFVF